MRQRYTPPPTPEQIAARKEERRLQQEATPAVLKAALDAHDRGEDPKPAMDAARARYYPPVPAPTLDTLVVGRIGDEGWTPERQRAFILHLAETGCVSHACRHVGLSSQSAYALRSRHPTAVFAMAWAVAARLGRQRLLDEATERALQGREVAVWHHGEQVGTRVVHNDRLLMFLLAHKSEPAHPVLDDRQLAELFPAMLAEVDAVLPPSLTPDRLAAMADEAKNGNDR